jgi:long-chain acyl-CoA synthetase
MPRFDARTAWAAMATHSVTLFAGVPTMYLALLEAQGEKGNGSPAPLWRLGMSGGAALPIPVIEAFERNLGLTLLEGYGLSETSPLATFSFPDTAKQAGSVGYPLYGTEVRLAKPDDGLHEHGDGRGEIQVRGHHVMKGYHRRVEATRDVLRGGWLATGDLGQFDANGSLRIVDRSKDVIIRAGYNVYPREIEEVLTTHPAVSQAAVIGLAHPRLGEEVAAAVVLRERYHVTERDLIEWLSERLAAHKYPRHVRIVPALPRNATGKIVKHVLRDRWNEPIESCPTTSKGNWLYRTIQE